MALLHEIIEALKAKGMAPSVKKNSSLKDIEIFSGFSSIEHATEFMVSFWNGNAESVTHGNGISRDSLKKCRAGLLFVPKNGKDIAAEIFTQANYLVAVDNPYYAMVVFLENFGPKNIFAGSIVESETFIHPSAVVEGIVEEGCYVGPHCVVMKGAVAGKKTRLECNVTIYPNVKIGEGCILQAGVVVGSRGFGFFEHDGKRNMVPHFAGVIIGDRCSFGANSVVASGFITPTIVGNDCHFDSMVQIGHNCELGNDIFMASQSALGGSTFVGDHVNMAGAAKASGHLTIGKNATVYAKAGVTKNVPEGATVAGFPAVDVKVWQKSVVELRLMAKKKLKK